MSIPQINSNSPTTPATPPSNLPATLFPNAPDLGAAVLLALGAAVVDDELEDAAAEELDEAAAELKVVDVVPVVEVVEVTSPAAVVRKGVVPVMIAVGTEAVDAYPSVAALTAPLTVEDALAPALEAASEAVASALWTAADAEARGTTGMGRCVGIPETVELTSATAFEAAVAAAVAAADPALAASVFALPATCDATAASSDAADWALAAA